MDKKKKIIIGIAIVIAIALVIGLFFLLNKEKEPSIEEPELTVRYLMELNEEYFKTLDSVDVTVVYDHDYVSIFKGIETKGHQIIEANTKKMFKDGLTEAQIHMKHTEKAENRDYNVDVMQRLYTEIKNGKKTTYAQEIIGEQESVWILNPEQKQLYGFTEATDFEYIGKYWMGLTIEDEHVDFNGTPCYKVTGYINNIKKTAEHYGLGEKFGYWGYEARGYAYVELYFNADTHIIQAFSYDFSEFWLDMYADVDGTGAYTNNGTMKLTVTYNGFNTVDKIVIDEFIVENAEVELKDPYEYPIDLEDNLYEIGIDGVQIKVGEALTEYKDELSLNTTIREEKGYVEDDIIYVLPATSVYVEATTANNNTLLLNVVNMGENAIPLNECIIYQVYINNVYSAFQSFSTGATKINKNSSIDDIINVWGFYNMKANNGAGMEYTWRCYDDWTDISITINHKTKQIDTISVYCFNIPNKLAGLTLEDYQKWQEEQLLAEQKKIENNEENIGENIEDVNQEKNNQNNT